MRLLTRVVGSFCLLLWSSMLGSFKNWVGGLYNWLKGFFAKIKNYVLSSFRVDNGVVLYSFPDFLNEDVDLIEKSKNRAAFGFLFEYECYFALVGMGLEEKSAGKLNFVEYEGYKVQVGEEWQEVKSNALDLAKKMFANATTRVGKLKAVEFMGGRNLIKKNQFSRADSADIKLYSERALGYSIKYYKNEPGKLLIADLSISSLVHILGAEQEDFDDIKDRRKIRPPVERVKNMISSILFKNYRTPDKFTDLLTYLINGGGNTDLAIYIKDGGNVLHGSDIFKDDFRIVNSVIYPKAPATVKLRRTTSGIVIDYKTENRKYSLRFYPNIAKWTIAITLAYSAFSSKK